MGKIEELAERYRNHIAAPWQNNLAGPQKIIFIVYPETEERRLRARLGLFDEATRSSGYKWKLIDLTKLFAQWLSSLEYAEIYFEEPDNLTIPSESEFRRFVVATLRQTLTDSEVDSRTVVGVHGVASLYGFVRVSQVLNEVAEDIQGRLVVFFPGQYENNNYRLLSARDGSNYLAVPITLHNGVSDL